MFCKQCGIEVKNKSKFCNQCGSDLDHRGLVKNSLLFLSRPVSKIVVLIIIAITFVLFYVNRVDQNNSKMDDIASSVVNIYCEGETEEDTTGGSGTIFNKDGLVLTNAHIIPENARAKAEIGESDCLVILPNPTTGAPSEIYHAYPILDKDLSEQYDIAFLQIHDVYYDEEEKKYYGEYPKIFPAYEDGEECNEDSVRLGEPVKVYGYPQISGGYALTVTDGVVSSLQIDRGLIVTSAKISHGNSGGLAIDQNGCMIGIPSMVMGDENESLGIIISNDSINEFLDKIQ